MEIYDLKINYQKENIILDKFPLIISWSCNSRQDSYQISIEKDSDIVYKGEKVVSSDSIIFIENLNLEAETNYILKIEITSNSKVFYGDKKFRTGIFGEFLGKWISDDRKLEKEEDYYKEKRNTILRKDFELKETPKEAFIYIVGLGYYNLYVNGKKDGNAVLNTDWTNYSKGIFYDTYNLQEYLVQGENIVFVELGNGWYNPAPLTLFGKYNLRDVLSIGEPKLLADLKIKSENDFLNISTDESWEVAEGQYLFNNIYLGEIIDFRLFNNLNNNFDFKDTKWKKASLTEAPSGKLIKSYIDKIGISKSIDAKKLYVNEKGNVLIDFEEMVEGFIDITFLGKDGQKVELIYGETLNEDETVNGDSSLAGFVGKEVEKGFIIPGGKGFTGAALQKDICILTEGKINYRNKFTYHSFRYVEISGIDKKNILEAKALYVHTKLKKSGSFECSDEVLNKLYEVAERTKINNTRSVFEDCARERLGYGGDIVALAESQIFMFDSETIYEKTVKDFRNDMRDSGGIPETAPFMGIKSNGTGDGAGPLGWQLAYPYIMDKLYKYYGNKRIISEEYQYLEKQAEYLNNLGLDYLSNCCLGDWGSREASKGDYKSNSPALNFTASCFYYYHMLLMSKFSNIIGHTNNFNKYSEISQELKNKIIALYKNEDGTFADRSQTSYVFAIYFELSEDGKSLTKELAEKLILSDYEIKCGIFGTSMTYEILAKYGHNDIIYKWLHSPKGFSQMLLNDETTLKEFSGDNSKGSENHAMFSSYVQWFYQGLGGINILDDSFGADNILIKPYFEEKINYVKSQYESVKGSIVSNWVRENGVINMHLEIPQNLKKCSLGIENRYKDCVKDYPLYETDENYIYVDISSYNGIIDLKLG